jgi:hypothetical protein
MKQKRNRKGKCIKIRVNSKLIKVLYFGGLPKKKVVKNNLEFHNLFGKK